MSQSTERKFARYFEPKVLAFCCNWCSYAGADLAGISRIQYLPNVRIVRVMCSGMVDPTFVIEAFLVGADGVLVLGCHLGDCHYLYGNYEAVNMMNATRRTLEHVGIDSRRFCLDWVSAAEGAQFAQIISNFTDQVRELGPLGAVEGKNAEELAFELRAVKAAVQGEKLRWVASKQTELTTKGNKYGEVFSKHEINRALESVIVDEVATSKILLLLRQKPSSVKEVAATISLCPSRVLRYIAALRRKGLVDLHSIEGTSPLYCCLDLGGS